MIRHSYSEKELAQLLDCTTRTVRRWKRENGLTGKVWFSDLRRLFPAAYESARLVASAKDSGGSSSEEE